MDAKLAYVSLWVYQNRSHWIGWIGSLQIANIFSSEALL